jgi:hypothetical protein
MTGKRVGHAHGRLSGEQHTVVIKIASPLLAWIKQYAVERDRSLTEQLRLFIVKGCRVYQEEQRKQEEQEES